MSLIIGVVALRDGKQIGLQQSHHFIKVVVVECYIHFGYCGSAFVGIDAYVIWQQALHQANTNLVVRDIELVDVANFIIIFDGEISGLIEQWNDGGHALGRRIESRSDCSSGF